MTQQKILATIEVALPDEVAARAALFGRVAEAWSFMVSNVERIAIEARTPPPKVHVANGEDEKPKPKNKGGRPRKRRR